MVSRLLCLLLLGSPSLAQYNLWPAFDATTLAASIGISTTCLAALPTLFKRTSSVDYYFWTTQNVTTLCNTECIDSAASWNELVVSTCANETYYYNNKAVPADTIPGRHVEGLNLACMTNSQSSSCIVESQSWVGSGMIYSADGTPADSQPLTSLYDNSTLCDECFLDMLTARVNSSYLAQSDYNDYMGAELWSVLEWCGADNNITLQAYTTFASTTGPPVISTTASTVSTTVSTTAAATTCTGQTVSFASFNSTTSNSTVTTVSKRQLLSGESANQNITQACLDISTEYYVPTGAVILAAGSSDCSNMTAVTCLPAECDLQQVNADYSTCDLLASELTVANSSVSTVQLLTWNPTLIGTCDSLEVGQYVCITPPGGSWTPTIANITNSTSGDSGGISQTFASTALTATATNNITTPTPIQTGMTTSCDVFYFVKVNDECDTIAAEYDITIAEFYAWNPAVGSDCSTLELGTYVCVDTIGSIANATATSTSSISTPSPIQTGITSSCDEFYLVVSGDECAAIASKYNITVAEFYSWNPAVGSSCANLDVGDYVCVAIPTSSVTTTTSGGISTPSPIQTGMPSNCDEFHLVVSGDTCSDVATEYGLSLSQFYSWNPAVGSDCSTLDLSDYVCVHISITTPSPTQTGMVSNCDSFYLVQSGDSCGAIASAESISLASLYSWNPAVGTSCADLYLSYYVCVGTEPTLMPTVSDTVVKRTALMEDGASMITSAPKRG
ncbi:hypothetical protein N7494_004688 [Penicillium frequentans]|uniref:LysM domain-containing protein n=1 Tax=Penicillium frequentans TaxID=3151616 RepID=A0AAD6D3I5_9EURO|nr:hypothetical protein N7494_004688 [Penicillium glabrum]